MRAIFHFFIKNYYFFLFVFLQLICVLLIVNNRGYQGTHLLNSANSLSASAFELVSNTKEYLSLKEQNRKLNYENALLKNALRSSAYEYINQKIFSRNDTVFRQKYIFMAAKVINNSTNFRSNFLTLNIGSQEGVVHDMAIINPEGIVGVVKDVSPNFCSALSILHKDVRVNCKLKRDGSYGPLSWEKDDDYQTATLTDIPIHARFKQGDTILTSALSSIFPEGIMVGTVSGFSRKSGDAFFTVKVALATQFKKLNHVYVIKNVFKLQQDSLELKSQKREKNDK